MEKSSIASDPVAFRPNPIDRRLVPLGIGGVVHSACVQSAAGGSDGDCTQKPQPPPEGLGRKAKKTGRESDLYQTSTVYWWPALTAGEQLPLKAVSSLRSPLSRSLMSSSIAS